MIKILGLRKLHLEKNLQDHDIQNTCFVFGKAHRHSEKRAKQFIRKVAEVKPDIFWLWKDQFITPEILQRVRKVSPKTKIVMWFGDQRGQVIPPLINSRKNLLDALFITNEDPKQKKMYKKFGIRHVKTFYHSFSVDEFKLWNIPITHNVFFGGSNFKPHKFPLSRLRTQFITAIHKNFKLVVHGGGWPFETKPWVLRPQYAKALRTAHINLGVNHYDILRYYNRRLFESVASGRMHLTYYIPGMEKHFQNRKHLVWFKTIRQARNLIRFYLENPKEREKIAKQGREFFIRNHSWPVRTKQFVKLIENIL